MRLSVIGCGYLGAVHAASMAELGHDVVGVDVDAHKVELLSNRRAPFFEPELEDLLARNVDAGRLTFTQDFSAIEGAQIHFIGVGTPQSESGAADMTYVDAAVSSMLPHLGHCTSGPEVVAGKSTVPVGTASRLAQAIEPTGALLVWNPEFLREGFAVQDTLRPDRMVYGLPADPGAATKAQEAMDAVYEQILTSGTPRLLMDYATAELVKISANAFLATKISFINAMSQVCDAAGANVTALAEAIGMDDRIGRRFLRAGIGFGGGCLPKDIRALQASADIHGARHLADLLGRVDSINREQRDRIVELARTHVGGDFSGKAITILGAAFKPLSDDVRDSPALDVASRLADLGAEVTVCDPQALPVVTRSHPHLTVEEDPRTALKGAELVLLLTEWDQFVALDPADAATDVADRVIIDGRNALDPVAWRQAGWTYTGVGR